MKKFYFKLQENIILDVIEYPYEDYIEVELTESHLPSGINAGYYRLFGSSYEIDENLKKEIEQNNESGIE